jgi:hypothetical protein
MKSIEDKDQIQTETTPDPIEIRKLDRIETTMNVSNPSGN